MKRITIVTITVIAMLAAAISLPGRDIATAATLQPQIKPTPRPELKLRWLSGVTLNKTTTVGSSVDGDITGTVHLLRSAISNLTVNLSLEGALLDEAGILVADLPTSVVIIPAGSDRATFRIQTLSSPNTLAAINCTVRARYSDELKSANFTVEPLRIASLNIVPAAGVGPFTAIGTMSLNARPLVNKTVALTSNNPVVRFGTVGSAQPATSLTFTSNNSQRTFQIVTSAVTQTTTVTITAQLRSQTLTRQITVRPAI